MEPTKELIEAELNQILSSPQIANSTVLSRFLKFIVQETLEGRSQELKEYTIGINVLKRDIDFNPQIDSIVRIHAGRLRRALKEYYYEEGREASLIISIPKGGYVPSFQINSKVIEKPTPKTIELTDKVRNNPNEFKEMQLHLVSCQKEERVKPKISLAVLPFRHIGREEAGNFFAQSISEYIGTEFTLFDYINVISNYTVNSAVSTNDNLSRVFPLLDPDYVLAGSVQFYGSTVRVFLQLINKNGQQLWGHTFEKNDKDQSLLEFQDIIVNYLIAHLTGINGVILRDQFRKVTNENELSNPVLPLYWYAQYDANYNELFVRKAKAFYNKLIVKDPDNALAHAYLSIILMGEQHLLPECKEENTRLGFIHGKLSLKLDPFCQQAYLAMATNYLITHEKNSCIHILEQGLKINPRNFDYQNAMGSILICMGELKKGGVLINRNFQINPNMQWWQKKVYTYYLYHEKKYEEAVSMAEQVNFEGVWGAILKSASYAQMGCIEEAESILNQLKDDYPEVDIFGPEGLKGYFCSEDFISELMEGLLKVQAEPAHP